MEFSKMEKKVLANVAETVSGIKVRCQTPEKCKDLCALVGKLGFQMALIEGGVYFYVTPLMTIMTGTNAQAYEDCECEEKRYDAFVSEVRSLLGLDPEVRTRGFKTKCETPEQCALLRRSIEEHYGRPVDSVPGAMFIYVTWHSGFFAGANPKAFKSSECEETKPEDFLDTIKKAEAGGKIVWS